jgi:hypothetical protein
MGKNSRSSVLEKNGAESLYLLQHRAHFASLRTSTSKNVSP